MSDAPLWALPEGWCWSNAEILCEGIDSGTTPPKQHFVGQSEGTPFLKVYNLAFDGSLDFSNKPTFVDAQYEREKMRRSRVLPGDVLTNIVGPPLGKVSVVPDTHACWNMNQAIIRFRPFSSLHNVFLSCFLQSLECKAWLKRTAKTTTSQVNLATTTCRRLPVPFAPRPEQQRIVEAIESYFTRLDDVVATLERVERNLKRYRASVLKAAVKGRLVPTEAVLAKQEGRDYEPASVLLESILAERRRRWSESGKKCTYDEPIHPDCSKLPELPDGWCWSTVDQLIDIIDYRGRTPPYSEEGIPHLRSSNVRDGKVVWSDLRFVSSETFDEYMTRGLPEEGDLLFTTEAPLGEVAFVPQVKFSLAQRAMILQPNRAALVPSFLYFQIQAPGFQRSIRFQKTGSGVAGISSRNLKPVPLALPPIAEQHRIASYVETLLSRLEHIAPIAHHNMQRCGRLRQSVLKWAFEGKLADQDPSDEPASVLLERIKAEREASKPTKVARLQRGNVKKKLRA